ncbi:hypothetical protein GCM10027030_14310 [Luteococcus sediminum]
MRRILFSSFMGSAIEMYDFLLYALATSLVFDKVFFNNLSPGMATVAGFATFAVGYLARPFGGWLFGQFGDTLGRKKMLVVTMMLMGLASVGIGLLPDQNSIGIAAPVLLLILRVLQGIGLGGEIGGAVLVAVEHAPGARRGFAASFANLGGPAGSFLAAFAMGWPVAACRPRPSCRGAGATPSCSPCCCSPWAWWCASRWPRRRSSRTCRTAPSRAARRPPRSSPATDVC